MALIEVNEPFATPPRCLDPGTLMAWSGELVVDDGYTELTACELANVELDLSGVERLECSGARLSGVDVGSLSADAEIEVAASVVTQCDLSRRHFRLIRQSRVSSSKLTGADFAAGALRDVEFVDCVFHLANFRMAELQRVSFVNCTFEDVDAYQARLEDVTFDGCRLDRLNLDATKATAVDLRGADIHSLTGVTNLTGYLIGEQQLPAMAQQLADAVGLSIERFA